MSLQNAPALGAYRQYVVTDVGTGKLVHISGLTSGEKASYDIAAQAEMIFERIGRMLAEQGGTLADLVKINAGIVEMREYDAYNAVRNRIFGASPAAPASATIGGAQLMRPGNRIEIDGVAFIANAAS